MHLVMINEGGRTVMRRVSSAEYAELKAARSPAAKAAIAPVAAGVASQGPSREAFVLNVPTVVKSIILA